MQRSIHSLDELQVAATALVATLTPKAEGATLVTLSGELGAGKTAFTKALASALGVIEPVTSPTFVLEKIYTLSNQQFEKLIHIDAYRLKEGRELESIGFDEAMKDRSNLIVLEWPERVERALPKAEVALTLVAEPDGTRTLFHA